MTKTLNELLSPERGADEPRRTYVKRRAYGNARVARWLRGKLVWNSDKNGTYRRHEHTLAGRGSLLDSWVERRPLAEVVVGGQKFSYGATT